MTIHKQFGGINLTMLLGGALAFAIAVLYYNGYRLNLKTEGGKEGDTFHYSVQVVVTPDESKAKHIAEAFQNDGYSATYYPDDSGYGRRYKVVVGNYDDMGTAQTIKQKIRRSYKNFRDSFVIESSD